MNNMSKPKEPKKSIEKKIKELKLKDNDLKMAWTWLFHEDILFSNRISYLTVIESMLIAAYLLTWSVLESHILLKYLIIILGFIGLSLTLLWLYVIHCQEYTLKPLKSKIDSEYELYKLIREYRQEKTKFKIHKVLGLFIPVMFIIIWIIFIIFAIWPLVS